jgi:outer membrane lipoprotein-sorting protein
MVIRCTFLLTILLSPLAAQTLDATLARMDQAAAGFRGISAQLEQVSHTAVIDDTAVESGTITLYRPKPRDLRMLVEFTQPDERAVSYANRKVQIYYPKIKTVQEYDLGKQGALIDQFLLLGFGTPGSELKRSYEVKHTGRETIDGVACDRLELTPREPEALKHVRRIEIWISEATGQPVRQKMHQPSKDYREIRYRALKLNPPLNDASVRLNLPKGVKRTQPQK